MGSLPCSGAVAHQPVGGFERGAVIEGSWVSFLRVAVAGNRLCEHGFRPRLEVDGGKAGHRGSGAGERVEVESDGCSDMPGNDACRIGPGQRPGADGIVVRAGYEVGPVNYDLGYDKIEYLRPRWYGSIEKMIQFGRECGTNTNWRGRVPLWRADAYSE